jgi:hypothetical protein
MTSLKTGQSSFHCALEAYRLRSDTSQDQAKLAEDYLQFLAVDPHSFERSNPVGHFTGSAFVVDPEAGKVLLTHHAKMQKWLQLGGHCDGIRDPFFVAWKEAYEEGGLKLIAPAGDGILDLSLHTIPVFRDVPEHLHYDVRYLFFADSAEGFAMSDESLDLAWVELGGICSYSSSEDLLRLEKKALELLGRPSGLTMEAVHA